MMVSQGDWRTTLVYHIEDLWLELFNLTVECIEENLASPQVVWIELMSLREKITVTREGSDSTQLESLAADVKHLLIYYKALRKQKRRADETGSAFSRQALERLKTIAAGMSERTAATAVEV